MIKIARNFSTYIFLAIAVVLTCLFFTACTSNESEKTEPLIIATSVEQVEDTQSIKICWNSEENLENVFITVKHGDDVVKKVVFNTFDEQTLNEELRCENQNSIIIEVFYGKHTVEIFAKKGARVSETQTKQINVYTDEYNIAPLVATVPVSVYTLGMKNYTNNYQIPTFFWLQRSNAWSYNALPNNVFPIPTATKEEITTEYSAARDAKTVAWIKELYEINNSSKFNFFCNDYWPTVWLDAVYGNNIPVENFKITLLSDGTASYKMFNDVYNNGNAQDNYNNYVNLWQDYKNGNVTTLTVEQCRALVYVWLQDSELDLTWVINRIDTIGQANETVKLKITELYNNGKIERYYLDKLWNALTPEEKSQIKNLYHIGDVFASAEENNKKPMIILGTSTAGEGTDLETYLTLLMNFYGDTYEYYYKGHPAYPTNANPQKQELLKNLNIHELESSIPAEFFYYFYPEVNYSGYGSSTFTNVGNEPSNAVFTKYENCDLSYRDHLEVFISKLSISDEIYGSLVNGEENVKFLIQNKSYLNNGVFTKVEVYDSTTKTFTTFNYVDNRYVAE